MFESKKQQSGYSYAFKFLKRLNQEDCEIDFTNLQ